MPIAEPGGSAVTYCSDRLVGSQKGRDAHI